MAPGLAEKVAWRRKRAASASDWGFLAREVGGAKFIAEEEFELPPPPPHADNAAAVPIRAEFRESVTAP
jgi:hypothetical protein